jgi:hypothetical protein
MRAYGLVAWIVAFSLAVLSGFLFSCGCRPIYVKLLSYTKYFTHHSTFARNFILVAPAVENASEYVTCTR